MDIRNEKKKGEKRLQSDYYVAVMIFSFATVTSSDCYVKKQKKARGKGGRMIKVRGERLTEGTERIKVRGERITEGIEKSQ